MNFVSGKSVLVGLFALLLSISGWAQCGIANQLYCQPWDGGVIAYASQNDVGNLENFATTYEDFPLTQSIHLNSIHWYGLYFNGTQAPINAWTATLYNDNGGIPGNPFAVAEFPGNGNETLITSTQGFDIYGYEVDFNSIMLGPGIYWVSVVPDLAFPPQWGWLTGTGGDGKAYQCFFGSCDILSGADMAFSLDGLGVSTTPEPGSLLLLGTGVIGLARAIRRKS